MSEDEPEIVRVSSRVVYENRWMRVREDAIRRRDGAPGIYGVVDKPDFVLVVPLEPDGSVHLVEQFRYTVGARYWEFPQGSWEGRPDADPLAVAHGELKEETGLVAGRMTPVGHLFQAYGHSNQGYHVFLAEDLVQAEAAPEPEEQGLVARRVALADLLAMVGDGRVKDGATVAALSLLHLKGFIRL